MRFSAIIPAHDVDPVEGLDDVIKVSPSSAQIKLWHAQKQRDMRQISGAELAKVEKIAASEASKAVTLYNPYTGEIRKAHLPDWYFRHREHEAPIVGWRKSKI